MTSTVMLVDLRAAIDDALGRGTLPATRSVASAKAPARAGTAPAGAGKPAAAAKPPMAAKAAAAAPKAPAAKFSVQSDGAPEFEVSGGDWNPSENQ